MLEYLNITGFQSMERINGVVYVVVKKCDADLYLYHIFKNENGELKQVFRCDSKTESSNYLKELRMDARDACIQAKRESLNNKGINASYTNTGRIKDIMDAYRESIED